MRRNQSTSDASIERVSSDDRKLTQSSSKVITVVWNANLFLSIEPSFRRTPPHYLPILLGDSCGNTMDINITALFHGKDLFGFTRIDAFAQFFRVHQPFTTFIYFANVYLRLVVVYAGHEVLVVSFVGFDLNGLQLGGRALEQRALPTPHAEFVPCVKHFFFGAADSFLLLVRVTVVILVTVVDIRKYHLCL